MPIVTNTQSSSIRAANTVMSRAYFPRAKDWLYRKLASSYVSISAVEPHATIGSVPPLELFEGGLRARMLPSYNADVPNLLFKNALQIAQEEYEFDQQGVLLQLSAAFGVRLAEFPDQLFCKRVLSGDQAGSQTVQFRGTSYTMTFDGQPFFSTLHKDEKTSGNQSNIIAGNLPLNTDTLLGSDYATNAQLMQRDLQAVIRRIKTIKDSQGIPFFPTVNMKKSIVIVVPPALEPVAALAFSSSREAVINQTTNVAPLFVRDVMSSGYLDGFTDPEDSSTTVKPTIPTQYYVFIVDDYIKPFYVQLFRPMRNNEMFPPGYDAGSEVNRIIKENSDIDIDAATLFASTRVDTTFRRIGAEADLNTIETEAFTISARYRGNIAYGPWFTGFLVQPSGTSSSSASA